MNDISIVVVGDSQCGKTQIIYRLANGYFSEVGNTNQNDLWIKTFIADPNFKSGSQKHIKYDI